MKELEKNYNPQNYEHDIYLRWENSGFFNPDNLKAENDDYFSISLPPPNATGILHLGHASMLAYQDIMIRYNRMLGKKVLWLPGTDHAAIATQNVVEKKIAKEQGKTKEDLGRKEFLIEVKDFVAGTQNTIRNQIKRMGSSLDWSRERYTLDSSLSKVVNMTFKKMYDDGLVYRGYRIVNWCPRCHSTLSDDEVEYKTKGEKTWFIDSINVQTRFMVGSEFVKSRGQKEIKIVLNRAKYKTEGYVTTITTDGFTAYPKIVKKTFGYYRFQRKELNHNVVNASRGDGFNIYIERLHNRSEERRVGKECRSRWSPYH